MNIDFNRAIELVDLNHAAYKLSDAIRERSFWSYGNVNCADYSQVLDLFQNPRKFSLTINNVEYKILTIYPAQKLDMTSLSEDLEGESINFLTKQHIPVGFIVAQDESKNIYVVFRGTTTPLESFKYGEICQEYYLEAWEKTTCCFQKIYKEISHTITDTLNKCPSDYQIFVTGHSLGERLANLCLPEIIAKTNFQNLPVLYIFASPSSDEPTFAEAFTQEFYDKQIQCYRIG